MWLIILSASLWMFLSHLIDLRPESAWSLRMNPWKNETSCTKVLRFPFVKCTRPDGLKLLQIRMICNLQVELARSIGANSFKILFFFSYKQRFWTSRNTYFRFGTRGLWSFSQKDWRSKVFFESSNAPRVWPFFLVALKHENITFNLKHYINKCKEKISW